MRACSRGGARAAYGKRPKREAQVPHFPTPMVKRDLGFICSRPLTGSHLLLFYMKGVSLGYVGRIKT